MTENDTSGPQYNDDWRYDSLVVGQRSFDVACFAASPELIDAGTVGEAMVGFDVSYRPVGHMELVFQTASGRAQLTDAADWGPC
jgi:hypothetical protein